MFDESDAGEHGNCTSPNSLDCSYMSSCPTVVGKTFRRAGKGHVTFTNMGCDLANANAYFIELEHI